jgi:predicted RNA-binding protein
MIHKESEDISFWVSQLEDLVKGFVRRVDLENLKKELEKQMEGLVKTLDLDNLKIQIEETMGHMKDDIVKIIVKLLPNSKENLPKGDDVGQETHEYKYGVLVDQPSINKHDLRGFDSNTRSN